MAMVFVVLSAWSARSADWALEANVGAGTALGSSSVKKNGKTGLAVGAAVRYKKPTGGERALAYDSVSLKNNQSWRAATVWVGRPFMEKEGWSAYANAGAGLGGLGSTASFDRLALRTGAGVRRSRGLWEYGVKTDLWYSPTTSSTDPSLWVWTVGLTWARGFDKSVPRKEPVETLRPEVSTEPVKIAEANPDPPDMAPVERPVPKPIRILFRFDRSDVGGSDLSTKMGVLARAANYLLGNQRSRAEIHGHADSRGPLGYNIALSRKRALAVKEVLMKRWGIAGQRIATFAHGSKRPTASNATAKGRAKNRRAVMKVLNGTD